MIANHLVRRLRPGLGGLLLLLGVSGCTRPTPPPVEPRFWPSAPYEFSIGILTGDAPFSATASLNNLPNPVLTAADVPWVGAGFVADPFLFPDPGGGWLLFFEIMDEPNHKGVVGLARSPDGLDWTYDRVVLDVPHHLSYPQVFAWQGDHYMLPEGYHSGAIRLYRAEAFPYGWTEVAVLVETDLVDNTIFHRDGRWWLFGSTRDNRTLHLFSSDQLTSGWKEHPESPIIQNNLESARMGGPVFQAAGKLWRVSQDCVERYGSKSRVYEILELTPEHYREQEYAGSPLLEAGDAPWATWGMHQFDPRPLDAASNHWLVVVDGYGPAQPDHGLDLVFANGGQLGGCTLRPHDAVPGGKILMRFYWDVPVASPPKMFVHAVYRGKTIFQIDHGMTGGDRQAYDIHGAIPEDAPPGDYEIWVGLFDPATGKRIPVTSRYTVRDHAVKLPLTLTVHPAENQR